MDFTNWCGKSVKGDAGRAVDWLFALDKRKASEELQNYVKDMEKRGLRKSTRVRRMSTLTSLSKIAYNIGASAWVVPHHLAGDRSTRPKKAASKTKYTCPSCRANAWAKPDARLVCGDCAEPMQAEEGAGEGD